MRTVRRPALAALVVLGSLAASPAWAEIGVGDYALSGDSWNSLHYLLQTAEEAEVEVEPVDVINMDRLGHHHVIFWIHPLAPLPTQQLLAFVRSGGRLIIADDLGTAAPLLESLGIHRTPGASGTHGVFHARNPQLPVLRGDRAHFTLYNVDEVVANHPGRLRGKGTPVLSYDGSGDEHLVMEVQVGRGSVLAIADPSIFITQMLTRFYGNKQFAANVLRVYLDRPQNRLLLALPHTTVSGTYGRLGPLPDLFRWSGAELNGALANMKEHLQDKPWPHLLAGVLLFMALILGRLATVRTFAPTSGPSMTHPLPHSSPRDIHKRALIAGREHADFTEPARALVAEGLLQAKNAGKLSGGALAAHLRIQGLATSLRASTLLRLGEGPFLSLADDVQALRTHVDRRHDATQ